MIYYSIWDKAVLPAQKLPCLLRMKEKVSADLPVPPSSTDAFCGRFRSSWSHTLTQRIWHRTPGRSRCSPSQMTWFLQQRWKRPQRRRSPAAEQSRPKIPEGEGEIIRQKALTIFLMTYQSTRSWFFIMFQVMCCYCLLASRKWGKKFSFLSDVAGCQQVPQKRQEVQERSKRYRPTCIS